MSNYSEKRYAGFVTWVRKRVLGQNIVDWGGRESVGKDSRSWGIGERMQSHEAARGWMGVPIAHLTSRQHSTEQLNYLRCARLGAGARRQAQVIQFFAGALISTTKAL